MTNIVCITNGARPRLFEQTIHSIYRHTVKSDFSLFIVHDGDGHSGEANNGLNMYRPCNIVGELKNFGALQSAAHYGRGEYLCFIDDDVVCFPGWLDKMIAALNADNQVRILGGVRHPFHGVNRELGISDHEYDRGKVYSSTNIGNPIPCHVTRGIQITDAVAGYCHFMRWSTWDRFGPYDAHAKGIGMSEDYAICRKVVEAGGAVGYIYPPVMAHCGITNSEGKKIAGAELIERIPGILYE